MREDGTMMRTTELLEFAQEHNLTVITIAVWLNTEWKETVQ